MMAHLRMYELKKLEPQAGGWWSIVISSPVGKAIAWRQWMPDKKMVRFKIDEKIRALNADLKRSKFNAGKKGWKRQRDEGTNETYSDKGNENRERKRKEVYRSRVRAYFAEYKTARENGRM